SVPTMTITAVNATAAPNEATSCGVTPASSASMLRPATYASATPTASPTTPRRIAPVTTMATTSRGCAPSATRTPISCVRCDTANDSRPWIPTAAKTNAIAANAPSTRTCVARDAVSASTMSASVCISVIATLGAAPCTAARIDGASAVGEPATRTERARRVEGDPVVFHLRRRQVHLRLALPFEPAELHVADDADDLAIAEREIE